jgi:subtilisin family serine protease/fibronectin type 3 domain-containing protein
MMSGARWRFGFAVGAIVLLAALLPGSAAAVGPSPAVRPDDAGRIVRDSWIVTLQPRGNPARDAAGLARSVGGTTGHIYSHALRGFEFHGSAQAAAALKRNPNVRTVIPNRTLAATADTIPTGVSRIRADHPTQPSAYSNGFRGAGIRIAIMDTGVDLTHPDLTPNLDLGLGLNCITTGPPQDGHGHGTHVAGIAAAAANGIGVIGVAPEARIVPIKVLDDTGQGEWSNLICAIDYVTGLDTDGDPTNDVRVANMSLGDTGSIGNCADGGVREAICTSTAVGIVYTAAAGNSTVDASTFIPAAFPEVITVSSINDLDGEPGGNGGCWIWIFYCDDNLSEFSNYGSVIDVAAPGLEIYSDWTGGGYNTIDGTSMAAPHVAGVAALALAVRPSLSPSDVEALLKATGDCPNTQPANSNGTCTGKGQWGNDPDGIAEPVVNALRAAQNAGPYDHPPTVDLTSPTDGSTVSGVVSLGATASDDVGVSSVEFRINGTHLATDSDGSNGWSAPWDTTGLAPGVYTVTAVATDTNSHTASDQASVATGTNLQGNWVGNFGSEGYALGGWNGATDLAVLPSGVTLSLVQGTRYTWSAPTSETRALQSPNQSERRGSTWTDDNDLQLRLNFTSAYTGTLHLYAVDWDSLSRSQDMTVNDGSGSRTARVTTPFVNGAWVHFPISVPADGAVQIDVIKTAGLNGVLSGVFLGAAGPPLPPPPPSVPGRPTLSASATSTNVGLSWTAPASDGGASITAYKVYRGTSPGGETLLTTVGNVLTYTDNSASSGTPYYYKVSAVNAVGEGLSSTEQSTQMPDQPGVQGSWVGNYGGDGYALAAWNGGSDVVSLPSGTTLTVQQASRYTWAAPTTDARGLQNASQTERRAATWYSDSSVQLRLDFTSAYSGSLHLYAVDWDSYGRLENITVNDGSGPRTVRLTTSIVNGAWAHFPLSVGAGGSVQITVSNAGGLNAVLSGIFLGNPPPSTTPSAPNLSAAATSGTLALSWTTPASNGGSPITGYKVYRGTSAGGEVLLTTLGNVLTYSDAAVTGGTRYYYRVSAVNAVGEGALSGERSAQLPDLPGVQGSWVGTYGTDGYALGAWNGGSDLVSLPAGATLTLQQGGRYSWAVPTSDVRGLQSPSQSERRATTWTENNTIQVRLDFASAYSGTLHLYAVDWDALGRLEDVTVSDGSGSATVRLTTAFANGAWMHFPVSVGAGGAIQITVTTTGGINAVLSGIFLGNPPPAATVPGAPTGVTATPGNGQVALSWLAPADGGSPITGYTATAAPGGATCSTAGLGCTVSGLSNGTTYSLTVRATNAVGQGPASSPASATPATVPGAPTSLTAAPGNGQASLSWTAPASDGGSPITAYTATAAPGGATCSTIGLGCTVTGLTNGTTYSFTVSATNAVGTGPASSAASATPATVPGAPTALTATRGNAQVSLSWNAPASDGGSAITSYTATASPGGATCSTSGLGCTVTGLTNGTSYSFTVAATNGVGSGSASAAASATPATVPSAPTGLAATRGNAQVALSWTAPASNGGSPISGYTVTASPGGATCSTSSLGCTVTGLTNGTTYSFTVTATNGVGTGPASASASATPATVPGAPTLAVPTAGNASVGLSWTPPASNGGSAITGYKLYRGTTPGGEALLVTLGNLTSYADTAVTNGTTYYYKVSAINGVGEGAQSTERSAKPAAVPGAPTGLTAAPNRSKGIDLTWAAPSSNGGSTVTGYRIYRSTSSGTEVFLIAVGSVTSYRDNATSKNTRYYYRIAAVNAVGEGGLSAEASAVAK